MLISSPPVLNNLEGNIEETALIILAVKFVVDELARRSWPAGGSILGSVCSRTNDFLWEDWNVPPAKCSQGVASGHAICSGWDLEIAEEWPGVSISTITSIPRWKKGSATGLMEMLTINILRQHRKRYLRHPSGCKPVLLSMHPSELIPQIQERQEQRIGSQLRASGND